MDAQRFDRLAKSLGTEMTRGRAIKALLGAGAGAVLGLVGTRESLAERTFCAERRNNCLAICKGFLGLTGPELPECVSTCVANGGCPTGGSRP